MALTVKKIYKAYDGKPVLEDFSALFAPYGTLRQGQNHIAAADSGP